MLPNIKTAKHKKTEDINIHNRFKKPCKFHFKHNKIAIQKHLLKHIKIPTNIQ
jgi:hypothetical protein